MILFKSEVKNKITQNQYNEVTKLATNNYVKSSQRPRWGQCVFNALWTKFPDTAEEITGTNLDPFYDDKRLEEMQLKIIK